MRCPRRPTGRPAEAAAVLAVPEGGIVVSSSRTVLQQDSALLFPDGRIGLQPGDLVAVLVRPETVLRAARLPAGGLPAGPWEGPPSAALVMNRVNGYNLSQRMKGPRLGATLGRAPIVERQPVPLPDVELLARLFRALGEASRLRILELLVDAGELHQAEIVRILGLSQARASDHLACLVWCGFVTSREGEGRRVYYRVADPVVAELAEAATGFLERNQAGIASCRRLDDQSGDDRSGEGQSGAC
jgi:DNA-binding transcriptional ArsR family regulator